MALETLTASDANTFDLLIIGSGPAGLSAAIYGKRANLKVGFIEKDVPGGKVVGIKDIPNYAGYKGSGADLALSMYEQATGLGAMYIYGNVVSIVQKQGYQVVFLENGVNYFARSCIIATGMIDIRLDVKGENQYINKGVSYCVVCDGGFTKGKQVAIFGNGEIVLNNAIYLAAIADRVYVINYDHEFSASTNLLQKVKQTSNIELITNNTCDEIIGDGKTVTKVKLKTREGLNSFINVGYVFVCVGSKPSSNFVANLNILDENGVIVVDENKQTKIKGLFAAGDIARNKYRQISTAVSDGTIAALAAIKYIKEEFK